MSVFNKYSIHIFTMAPKCHASTLVAIQTLVKVGGAGANCEELVPCDLTTAGIFK